MAVVESGRAAKTSFTVLEELSGASYLEVTLETGRTHQIRVHLAAIGHPLLGDTTYGPAGGHGLIARPALHAYRLSFPHPRTGEVMEFRAPKPADFEALLDRLRLETYGPGAANTETPNKERRPA
jgi:23S rRNA pseudouridine1911/1915/1917 synthase